MSHTHTHTHTHTHKRVHTHTQTHTGVDITTNQRDMLLEDIIKARTTSTAIFLDGCVHMFLMCR
jgi:hypothetical protein